MKTIIAILFALFSTCAVNAQTTYTLDQLIGTKWKALNIPEQVISTMEFASNEIKYYAKFYSFTTGELRNESGHSQSYYLSNAIPSSFDHTKVGKVKKGSYIILYNSKINRMEYFYIRTFTKDKLVLYHKRNYKDMEDDECTLYYERVK